ncbi:MAG: 1-deoxy-D-xylulose-5-phosphate reductoisomerase [Syntrophales bacterium]
MKKISILGSTGSIGVNALEVIASHPRDFKAVALAAGSNIQVLKNQIERFRPRVVAVVNEEIARAISEMIDRTLGTKVLWGSEGYREIAALKEADMVVSAIVGAAGLLPTVDAIESGKHIALANKETMVMAGEIVVRKAAEKGIRILPVDSEHSAVFQCLEGHGRKYLKRIILTASGGPFLQVSRNDLKNVTVADALRHPNWKMGRKITVDSATMINKGLEVIEAKWFFGARIDEIDIVIHPQSIVHSMVEYVDGSVIAQMGVPDMKGPIAYALSYPDRISGSMEKLDLLKTGRLEFLAPDIEKFPGLRLAYEAGREGGTKPAVLNASNEVAVGSFIAGKIGFTDIADVIERCMNAYRNVQPSSIKDILDADRWARNKAEEIIRDMPNDRN